MLNFLICPTCHKETILPSLALVGALLSEPYQPEGETFGLVCDGCGHLRTCRRDEIKWAPIQEPAANRGFWRVEMPCSEPTCAASIFAHIRTLGRTSRSVIGAAIARALPTPICNLLTGRRRVPYPERIDFIEWSGGVEYVV